MVQNYSYTANELKENLLLKLVKKEYTHVKNVYLPSVSVISPMSCILGKTADVYLTDAIQSIYPQNETINPNN